MKFPVSSPLQAGNGQWVQSSAHVGICEEAACSVEWWSSQLCSALLSFCLCGKGSSYRGRCVTSRLSANGGSRVGGRGAPSTLHFLLTEWRAAEWVTSQLPNVLVVIEGLRLVSVWMWVCDTGWVGFVCLVDLFQGFKGNKVFTNIENPQAAGIF